MNHEHFFSDGGLTPHFFFIFIFLRRRSYPSSLHLSILWSSPGGELLVVTVPHEWTTTKTLLNNNTEPWTFFSVMVVLPLIFSYSFFEKKVLPFFVSFVNPLVFTRWKGPPGLHQGGGRACPKITARCWEIVSVGQLLVRQFQWEMLGLTLTIFDRKIHDFWVFFPINLVVLCPWLCAINSVDPISSLDFLGPCYDSQLLVG